MEGDISEGPELVLPPLADAGGDEDDGDLGLLDDGGYSAYAAVVLPSADTLELVDEDHPALPGYGDPLADAPPYEGV